MTKKKGPKQKESMADPLAVPPGFHFVQIYFNQKTGGDEDAHGFFAFYNNNGWTTPRGVPIRSWKKFANDWIWQCRLAKKKNARVFTAK